MYDAPQTSSNYDSDSDSRTMFVVHLLVLAPIMLFNGWVLSVVWNWFIPNIFPGTPTLSIGMAIGLSLVVSAFVRVSSKKNELEDLDMMILRTVMDPILYGLLLLLTGAIVHAIVF